MENSVTRLYSRIGRVPVKVMPGHFATNHAHVNYYIDMTTLKARQSEAQAAAAALAQMNMYTVVDTIVCLDGTEVLGAYLAEELTKAGVMSMNAHKTMYIVTPEFNSNSQMIFRDNIRPMIAGKQVLLLMANITTGLTINKAVECIRYYQGVLEGVSAVFSLVDKVNGFKVCSIFSKEDVPDYRAYPYQECPYCRDKIKLDALVNSFGYSKL